MDNSNILLIIVPKQSSYQPKLIISSEVEDYISKWIKIISHSSQKFLKIHYASITNEVLRGCHATSHSKIFRSVVDVPSDNPETILVPSIYPGSVAYNNPRPGVKPGNSCLPITKKGSGIEGWGWGRDTRGRTAEDGKKVRGGVRWTVFFGRVNRGGLLGGGGGRGCIAHAAFMRE